MKRVLAAVLALALTWGIMGTVPALADSPMVITVFRATSGEQPTQDNKIYRMIEQELGVKFQFEFYTGNNVTAELKLRAASGTLPDVIDAGNYMDEVIREGLLGPMTSLVSLKDTPDLYEHIYTDDRISKMKKDDGQVYVVPNYGIFENDEIRTSNNNSAFFIQKRVIAWNNYKVPKTLNGYFDLIERFLAAHPTDDEGNPTTGFLILCEDWRRFCLQNPVQHLMGRPNDGEVIVDPDNGYHTETYINQDYAKHYYAKLNEEYHKGVIPADTFGMNYDQYIAVLSQGNVLGMFDQGWDFGIATSALYNAKMYDRTYLAIPLVYDPEYVGGKTIEEHYLNGSVMNLDHGLGISVTCSEQKRKKIAQVMNTLLSDRWQIILNWGIQDQDYYVENGRMLMTWQQYENYHYNSEWKRANRADALFEMLPKKQGTMDDGNAWSPDQQAEIYQMTLCGYDSDFLASCGKGSFGDFFNPPIEPAPYGEAWEIDKGPIDADYRQFVSLQDAHLPQIIQCDADQIDDCWSAFQDEIGPFAERVTDYMQEEILGLVDIKGELWGSGDRVYFTGAPDPWEEDQEVTAESWVTCLLPVDYAAGEGIITDWTLTQISGEEGIFRLIGDEDPETQAEDPVGYFEPAGQDVPAGDYKFRASCRYKDRLYESPVNVHVYELTEEVGIDLYVALCDITDSGTIEITGDWEKVENSTLRFLRGEAYALHGEFTGDEALANLDARFYNTEMYKYGEEDVRVIEPAAWDWNEEIGSYTAYRMPETGAAEVVENCWLSLSVEGCNLTGQKNYSVVLGPPAADIMVLPAAMTEIGASAFEGVSADTVYIPAGCGTVGANAFAESDILYAHIAGAETTIGDGAFPEGTVIYAPEGSAAQTWANENGYPFVAEP